MLSYEYNVISEVVSLACCRSPCHVQHRGAQPHGEGSNVQAEPQLGFDPSLAQQIKHKVLCHRDHRPSFISKSLTKKKYNKRGLIKMTVFPFCSHPLVSDFQELCRLCHKHKLGGI